MDSAPSAHIPRQRARYDGFTPHAKQKLPLGCYTVSSAKTSAVRVAVAARASQRRNWAGSPSAASASLGGAVYARASGR